MDFAFVVNGKTASGGSQDGYRDASEVTLTDVLPQYTDKDGATRTAVFDAEENPGRTLADDGMTVSKTYTGANSEDVLVQIYNDALHLRFPGLRFATGSDGNASVNLTNTVRLSAVPSNASEGETRPSAEDDIRFRVTTTPSAGVPLARWPTRGISMMSASIRQTPIRGRSTCPTRARSRFSILSFRIGKSKKTERPYWRDWTRP